MTKMNGEMKWKWNGNEMFAESDPVLFRFQPNGHNELRLNAK